MSEEITIKKYCGCGRIADHSDSCEFKKSTELRSAPLEISTEETTQEEPNEIKTTVLEPMAEPFESIHEPLDMRLVALNRQEMQSCQSSISQWIEQKISYERQKHRELKQNFEIAVRNKWRSGTLKSNVERAKQSISYYQKMRDAVHAGYTIVPDFPMDVFAIRVTRKNPRKETVLAEWDNQASSQQAPDRAASGEGKYVAFNAQRIRRKTYKDSQGELTYTFENDKFQNVIFPLVAVKPEIMSATEEAMALKIFDQIGICPATERPVVEQRASHQDPMIIGRVIGNVNGYKTRKQCSFLIGWFIDTRSL